ncbi:NAD(P)-binding protein [Mycena metata]|uniref:NAD(P)-binding protein n=1 Tax=Mycena metata TaxID=1033252 RepID=A0AAD7K6X6_9AGAR|nr:NAD(P)-binding protein [Mycena metata]
MTISSNPTAPLVVVVGSTGKQGGSVIQALAESDKEYRIRGLTRDVSKPQAQRIATQGVEMMNVNLTADNADAARAAFKGANIAFIVTNFWEHLDKAREVAEGKMLVATAKAADVELLVWSGLESAAEVSQGKYGHVDHFDSKAEITTYARKSGVQLLIVQAGAYASNHLHSPQKEADGTYTLGLPVGPNTILPIIDAVHDYGLFVREGIECPKFGAGTEVLASAEDISVAEMLVQLSMITGKKVVYKRISDEEFMAATRAPHHVALELLEMWKYFEEFGYFGDKDTSSSRQHLNRTPHTWADFVREADWSSILV